jgi:hypothetical protein
VPRSIMLFSRPSVYCFKPGIQMRMPPFRTQDYDKNGLIVTNAHWSASFPPTGNIHDTGGSHLVQQIHKVPASADTTPNRTPHRLHLNGIINRY